MNESQSPCDVLVAGGGVAGLACAAALSDVGVRVAVFEASERLGGRAGSAVEPISGEALDAGPHVLLSEYRNLLALMRRLGTDQSVHWQTQPLVTLFDHGRRITVPVSSRPPPWHGVTWLPAALQSVSLRDLWPNLRVAWLAARMDQRDCVALDGIDADHFLRQFGVPRRFIDWYWRSIALTLLNVPLEQCSAAALMRVFRLLIGRSGYCFGFPRIALAQLFVPGCRSAVERAGGCVRVRTPVRRVLLRQGRFAGFELADGEVAPARQAVIALPPRAAHAVLVDQLPPGERWLAALTAFEPSPYLCTYVWFDRRITEHRFWCRVWSASDLNSDFYDVANIRSAASVPSLIASNAIHAVDGAAMSDREVIARTRAEIAEFAPVAAVAGIRHAVVHRVPMAIPCPRPGIESLRPVARSPIDGLWFAGDWTATGMPASMESASRSAALAAEQVAASLGRRLQLAQPVPDTVGPMAWLRGHKGVGPMRAVLSAIDGLASSRRASSEHIAAP